VKSAQENHVDFLNRELKEQTHHYKTKIYRSALNLLEEDEVFSTQFVKLKNGELILKFRNKRGLPRKGEHLTAVLLSDEKRSFRDWGRLSWAELRNNYQIEFTDVACIWHGGSYEKGFNFVGFRGVSIDFSERLTEKCIVILGPKEPPYQYLQNLSLLVRNSPDNSQFSRLIDISPTRIEWSPSTFTNTDKIRSTLVNQLALSGEVVIQGPPGTGKTFLMAELAESFLTEGKSVLVTALTNRALIELASKPALKEFLAKKQVHKTNLTTDEQKTISNLQNSKEVICLPGNLSLATFHVTSGLAADTHSSPPFDYVIMDEASQAFLAMFAATKLLGENIIWIGDPFQLSPIVSLNDDIIQRNNYRPLIDGMTTVCKNHPIPAYQLTKTYRLPERGAQYTGVFYQNSLDSISPTNQSIDFAGLDLDIARLLNPKGGPTLVKTKMPIGDPAPAFAVQLIVQMLYHMSKTANEKVDIAVLAKLRRTVKSIQQEVANTLGSNNRILVDTIERVQGLTTDIAILFIPNTMQEMSLTKSIFNVATSRARAQTLIIADTNILDYEYMDSQVRQYLSKLNEEFSFELNPHTRQSYQPTQLL